MPCSSTSLETSGSGPRAAKNHDITEAEDTSTRGKEAESTEWTARAASTVLGRAGSETRRRHTRHSVAQHHASRSLPAAKAQACWVVVHGSWIMDEGSELQPSRPGLLLWPSRRPSPSARGIVTGCTLRAYVSMESIRPVGVALAGSDTCLCTSQTLVLAGRGRGRVSSGSWWCVVCGTWRFVGAARLVALSISFSISCWWNATLAGSTVPQAFEPPRAGVAGRA